MKNPEERFSLAWKHVWAEGKQNTLKTLSDLTHLMRDDETTLIPSTGLELNQALTRHFGLDGKVRWTWGDRANRLDKYKSEAVLGANWQAAKHWLFSLQSRWDSDFEHAKAPERDLLNNVFLTLSFKPQGDG